MKLSSIIQPEELVKLGKSDFILFDVSAGSKPRYDEQHLDGAFYLDLNTDLADIKDFAIGGRHPLPSFEHFARLLGLYGVTKDTLVIVYDDKNGSNAAARFWWMLKSIGHEKVQVLNGGYNAAIKAGFAVNAVVPSVKPAEPDQFTEWQWPLAEIDEVEAAGNSDNHVIIDVRDANRFAGLTEPIDLIAGHIPNAINIPFTENLDANGAFFAPEILKEKYSKALADYKIENVIVHCGSGVTACHTLLAIDYAGLEMPKLYVGSWSEWSRNNKKMILA
ncbi:sulfurtransferase [Pedobacter cryoconitis]|uniref:Thiosulfate/3-mercaptopyruvate sulfurtransferase n=1 Tax=Pedobacter cryoconitis TaxID=188932 RepID=A0A7X0IZX3_9SPHI|nr:sulfurtransferase [Pedobacter cryoconitis]MBB6498494.1 thiosulfate/3-mercaptopyruvate sulfurtransferase [Pedobacter cryoconitis]